MSSICSTQIQAQVLQVTRLTECGLPVTGTGARGILDGFITVDVEPDRQPGDPFNVRDGSGIVRVYGADPAQVTTGTVALEVCVLDPEVLTLLDAAGNTVTVTGAPSVTGSPIPVTGSPAVGVGFSTREDLGPVALELWAEQPGECAGERCWNRWLLARVVNLRHESLTFENGTFALRLTGNLLGNPLWGNGIDGEYPRAVGVDEPLYLDRYCDPPPTEVCGTVAVTGAAGTFPGLGDVRVPGTFATQFRRLALDARTRPVNAVVIGDSIEQGAFATNWRTHGYLGLVNTALQNLLGDGGAGMQNPSNSPAGATGSYIPQTGAWFPADGGAAGTVATGLGTSTMTFNQTRGRYLRVHYQSAPGITGRLGVTVDGGAQQVVQTSAPYRDRVLFIDTGSSGAHTVVITALDTIVLAAVDMRNDTGWIFHNNARGGRDSADPLALSIPSAAGIYNDTTDTVMQRGVGRPDLLFYGLIGNDAIGVVPPATHYANVLRTLDNWRAVNPDVALVLLADHGAKIANDIGPVAYQQYVDNLERAANLYGGAFVDLWAAGDNSLAWMQARGYMTVDDIHWTDAGHAWAAEVVLRVFKSSLLG